MTTVPAQPVDVSQRDVVPRRGPSQSVSGRRVLSWSGIVLVSLLVLEVTCRIEDWVMYRSPILSPVRSLDDLVIRDADGMHARPSTEFQKWKINGLGMRGPERAMTAAPATVRLAIVGASETFGLRESPDREYPRQLEDSLSAWVARGACGEPPRVRVEVLNAAFAGMSLPTIEQDVRLRLRRLQPDVVVIYPSPAQYLQEEAPGPAQPDSSAQGVALPAWHAWQPRVVPRFREQLKQMLPRAVLSHLRNRETMAQFRSRPPGWRFGVLPADRLALFDGDLRRLLGTVRSIGARPVLVTHANLFMNRPSVDDEMLVAWGKFYPRATGPVIVAFDSAARVVTMRAGADSGVTVVDAARRMAAAPPSAFADFVHFTDAGASIMAAEIGRALSTRPEKDALCQPPRSVP